MREIFKTKLTDVTTDDRDGVGSIRIENNKVYKYVRVQNTTATVAGASGDPVAYFADTGHDDSRVVIDLTDADAIPICAGFLLATITGTLATAYYCWIQLTGAVTVTVAITSGADGAPVYLTTTDKTLAKAVEVDSAGTYKVVCGIAKDASDKTIIADCPW